MASFKVLKTQFQMFINSQIYLNDEYIVMTRNYFLQYTQLDIPEFRETLVQFMEYVKKSIDERALHKMEYDSRVNERQTQTTEEKIDTSNALDALDASSVIIESNGTESQKQDTSSRSRNDADIRPIYDEEPMAEVQMTADDNVSATGQQHTEQPESNNEGEVDQNADQCYDTRPLPAKLTDNTTTELSNQLLESENVCLKKTVAQFQKDFAKLEAHCINLELQMENNVLKSGQQSQFLKEKSNEAKVKNDIDVTETINIELEHSVAKLLAENVYILHKEKEHLKQTYKDLFDSIKRTRVQTKNQNDSLMEQLNKKSNENADVLAQIQKKGFAIAALKNELRKLTGNSVNTKFAKPSILGKPVGQPLKNQSVVRQPTAFKSERPRISKPRFASQVDVNNDLSKPVTTHHLPKGRESAPAKPHHMIAPSSSRYSSNDIVHNHYLEEAKKKTHEHSRIPRNFSDSKHFVCSTCQKCVFNANHDACVIKFLKEVNSRAKVPSNKTTNRNKPVEQIRVATKPKRQIPKGHRFSIKKTTTVHEKTTSPRSCLRWQPTGRILKTVCLRWVPTGKTFASSTTKVESEPPNGSNADIPNQCESEQALNVSAGTLLSTGTSFNPTEEGLRAPFLNVQMTSVHISSGLVLHQMTSDHNRSELGIHDHSNEPSSSKLVPKVVWVPTGKLLNSCTGKVENKPTHGSNVDIPHILACKQTLNLSAVISFNGQKQQRIDLNADALYNEIAGNLQSVVAEIMISKKQLPEWVSQKMEILARSSMFKDVDRSRTSLGLHYTMTSVHIRDDLLTGGRDSNLYTISISDMAISSPICLMSKATSQKVWIYKVQNSWKKIIFVLLVKEEKAKKALSKKASHPPKLIQSDYSKLELLHMDLCGPMRVASVNGKKYILVIVDDFSRFTWVYFLHSKDETPEIIKKFIA
ncbi:putative ribonuclease H-like domain-containing protein [Tanacetum coccineum]